VALDLTRPVAMLVGCNRYRAYSHLKGARGDAQDMEAWLRNGCGVPESNITSLLSAEVENGPYVPIGAEVHNWLDMLDEHAEANPGKDFPLGERVYVMFAGHGYNAASVQQTAIFPKSSKTNWDVVPIVPIKTYLELSGYFREVIIISDACRDAVDYAPDPGWTRRMDAHPNSTSVNVFQAYAAKAGQVAKERQFGADKFRGVMTQAFLRGVTGAARDSSGQVKAGKLKNFIKAAVIADLGEAMKPEIIESDDFVIANAPEVRCRCRIVPHSEKSGSATLRFHEGNQDSRVSLSDGAQVYEIPIGQYTLTTPGGKELKFAAVWEEQDVII
jgi:hypothetical protein